MAAYRHANTVVTSDASAQKYKALYVGGAGNIKVLMVGDTANTTFNSVPAGTTLTINVQFVYATGTTATNLVGLN
jgi:hypothetical protein